MSPSRRDIFKLSAGAVAAALLPVSAAVPPATATSMPTPAAPQMRLSGLALSVVCTDGSSWVITRDSKGNPMRLGMFHGNNLTMHDVPDHIARGFEDYLAAIVPLVVHLVEAA